MPTYDYKCSDCGITFEKFQKITENNIPICPNCGSKNVKKLIGAGAGIIFKGSGFYITDYKKNNSSKKESTNKTNISKTKTETKKNS